MSRELCRTAAVLATLLTLQFRPERLPSTRFCLLGSQLFSGMNLQFKEA